MHLKNLAWFFCTVPLAHALPARRNTSPPFARDLVSLSLGSTSAVAGSTNNAQPTYTTQFPIRSLIQVPPVHVLDAQATETTPAENNTPPTAPQAAITTSAIPHTLASATNGKEQGISDEPAKWQTLGIGFTLVGGLTALVLIVAFTQSWWGFLCRIGLCCKGPVEEEQKQRDGEKQKGERHRGQKIQNLVQDLGALEGCRYPSMTSLGSIHKEISNLAIPTDTHTSERSSLDLNVHPLLLR